MLGFAQSVVGRCWSSKGLQLRTSSSVLHRFRMPSPHETYNDITKLLPASARYLSLCLPIRPFSFPYSPRSFLPHHICAFGNSSSLPLGCCALPCLSGLNPNLLFLHSICIAPASAATRTASFKSLYRTRARAPCSPHHFSVDARTRYSAKTFRELTLISGCECLIRWNLLREIHAP